MMRLDDGDNVGKGLDVHMPAHLVIPDLFKDDPPEEDSEVSISRQFRICSAIQSEAIAASTTTQSRTFRKHLMRRSRVDSKYSNDVDKLFAA